MAYTFKRGESCSYIDHILVPAYVCEAVRSCTIQHSDSDNLSDHYAVTIDMDLTVHAIHHLNSDSNRNETPVSVFERPTGKTLPSKTMSDVMSEVSPGLMQQTSQENCQDYVDELYDTLQKSIHRSVNLSLQYLRKTHQRHKPKSWWDKNCQRARDRNRLFHRIWKSCGRPSDGQVYDCYRVSRKTYRKCCRDAVRLQKVKTHQLIGTL